MPSGAELPIGPVSRALLCCARIHLDEASRQELRALVHAGFELAALAGEAKRHGLTALLCRHMQDLASDAGPAEVLADLRAAAQRGAAASLALAAELVAVLQELREAGVAALAIKGPVSAALCYGDFGVRSFSDLDLLVEPAEVGAATACLEARGYCSPFALSPAWRARLLRSDSELLFRHADGRRLVDLHWCLLPRGYTFTPGHEGVFARRQMVRIGPSEVPTLGIEATLLFLLLHGMKHDWQSLGWLCDVAELLRRHPGLDWDAVLAWSARRGPRRLIDIGLALAHALLDAPVPARALLRGRADVAVARIADGLARRLFAAPTLNRSWLPRSIFSYQYLLAMETPGDRLRFLYDVVLRPTPLEWRAVPLPAVLAPLYYLVRPARLLWKHRRPRRAQGIRSR